ncbi:MAG: response regulator [Clostridia bacterium]|nr:response regulator [Clostridia bacterium]
MSKILVVDDEKSIRNTFEIFLSKEGNEVFTAEDVRAAVKIFESQPLDLIITDIIMPKSSGIELLHIVKSQNPTIPVIIMTGEPTIETAKESVKSSADDYLIKPVSKELLLKTANYALEKKKLNDEKSQLESENEKYRMNLENLVFQRTEALRKAVNGTIETIAKILEHKDPYTAGHERRVGFLAFAISKKMQLSEQDQRRIFFAGYLHDIGKLLIASEILAKPGKLTQGEFCVIKEHVNSGYELVKNIELPWPITDIILQHHERMDGSGYPNGLKGEEILFEARILAIADVIEAMTSHRPYRPGYGIEIALNEIKKNMGTLYDKQISEAVIELFEKEHYDFSEIQQPVIF